MKLFLPILFLMVTISYADFDKQVDFVYPETVKIVEQSFPGEISKDMSLIASIRCVHENGLLKSNDYSVPGLGCGGWNREILNKLLLKLDNPLSISRVFDSEGACMMSLKGDLAHFVSAATIAHLFDYYIFNLGFSETDKILWKKLTAYSYLGSVGSEEYKEKYREYKIEADRILKKCNRMYGPGAENIEGKLKAIQKRIN